MIDIRTITDVTIKTKYLIHPWPDDMLHNTYSLQIRTLMLYYRGYAYLDCFDIEKKHTRWYIPPLPFAVNLIRRFSSIICRERSCSTVSTSH